jgi:hypothetical protein
MKTTHSCVYYATILWAIYHRLPMLAFVNCFAIRIRSQMANFDERTGNLYVTENGRVASHFYIRCAAIASDYCCANVIQIVRTVLPLLMFLQVRS